MSPVTNHATCGMQDFILSHFMSAPIVVYCGHKGEAYSGLVVDCIDGILTLEKDGQRMYVACDKIECIKGA